MPEQLMLSSFSEKTIPLDEATKGFRPWNNKVFDWEVEYRGYSRDEDEVEGYIDFHIVVEIREALVKVKKEKSNKKVEVPGYVVVITQNMVFETGQKESYVAYDESFIKAVLKKAFDVFMLELLEIQTWINIAESRARLIPIKADVFECNCCGWVTHKWADDIFCDGCGKRYWSRSLWEGLG